MDAQVGRPRSQRPLFMLIVLVVLVAGAEFVVRGPLRSDGARDLASPYVSSLEFVRRENPYSPKTFLSTLRSAGAAPDYWVNDAGQHTIYPPISLAAFTPFTLLSWPNSNACYRWLCAACYLAMILMLAGEVGSDWFSTTRLGFIAFSLALTSVQAGIYLGNISILSFVLCGFALLLARRHREGWAGVALAIGFCLKPTTAIALVVLIILHDRRVAYTFVAFVTLLLGASLIAMSRIESAWRSDYASNVQYMFGPSGAASFTTSKQGRFDLLNLQLPVYELTGNALASNVVSWTVAILLVGIWVFLFIRTPRTKDEFDWLSIGSLSLIALLPVYQRNYNIGVVVFTLLWAFKNIDLRTARIILVLCAIFLVPGEAILRRLTLPPVLTDSSLWRVLLLPQASWAILALACVLLYVWGSTRLTRKAICRT